MPNAVRFLFTGTALQKIDTASVQVEDIEPGGPPNDPPPGSMRLRFRQTDPAGAQICPLIPGTMQFLVDNAAPGVIPDPATSTFTEAAAAGWKTRGRIVVTADKKKIPDDLAAVAPALLVKPNRVWYGFVQLPPAFLFQTLVAGLKKAPIPIANGTIRTTNPNWPKHAIAAFLSGRYLPTLESPDDATQDDRVRFVMPTVEVAANGDVELIVITAAGQDPQDARDTLFDDPRPPVSRDEPTHPRNGLIPAREVYRRLRPAMVADPAAVPLMDAMLADWPNAPRFLPIQFTRTWEATPNCSVFFPRHTVHIRPGPAAVVREQRLPAHGVVYVRQEPPAPLQPAPDPPLVEVWLTGGTMKWLLGGGTSWRDPGQTAHLAIDLNQVLNAHVCARLPMTEAMLSDVTRADGCILCCTYMSLRRTVRALIDNRIAGGRLNFGVGETSVITRGIIQRAWEGTPAAVGRVADNAPVVSFECDPDVEAPKLIPVLEAFFPGDAPQVAVAGAAPNPIVFSRGRMLHDLWQSRVDEFGSARERANFPSELIGRGGPGAAVGMGIATFHVDPVRQPAEVGHDDVYFRRVTNDMLVGLLPGAVLQFWSSSSDFEQIKARQDPGMASGHSPVFVSYIGPANAHTGIRIIDQNGNSSREVHQPPARPLLGGDEIWVAANWTE